MPGTAGFAARPHVYPAAFNPPGSGGGKAECIVDIHMIVNGGVRKVERCCRAEIGQQKLQGETVNRLQSQLSSLKVELLERRLYGCLFICAVCDTSVKVFITMDHKYYAAFSIVILMGEGSGQMGRE